MNNKHDDRPNELENAARRKLLAKSAYATPLLLTMHVTPSLAQTGSAVPCTYDPTPGAPYCAS